MPVAVARVRTTLDRSIVGNGHRAGIALAAIGGEVDVHEGRAAHDNIGNADGRSLIQACARSRDVGVLVPMKLMSASELRSTEALEIS